MAAVSQRPAALCCSPRTGGAQQTQLAGRSPAAAVAVQRRALGGSGGGAAAAAARPLQQQRRLACRAAAQQQQQGEQLPAWMPAEAAEIKEPAARQMMASMRRVELEVPGLGAADTAFVGPAARNPSRPAYILLHGFDSSCLEFRRFYPLASERLGDVYAVDLVGWGFTDAGFGNGRADQALGPAQKRAHLRAFIEQVVGGGPVTLVGTSLGGTVALDYATAHAADLERLVLVDAQGFIDGIGPMASMPRLLATLGVKVLRSVPLRQAANKMAYCDKERFATDDAMRIGRLHTHLPGWTEANVAFMQSGGYAVSQKIAGVQLPTLVIWGRNDEILSPDNAQRFIDTLPNAQLVWVDQCGHCAHLEQPHALVDAVAEFVGAGEPVAAA